MRRVWLVLAAVLIFGIGLGLGLVGPMLRPPILSQRVLLPTSSVESPESAIAKVKPSVVRIRTSTGSGSGVVIDTAGHILTNNHVVDNVPVATVMFGNGDQAEAQVFGRDWILDLALLKLAEGTTHSAKTGDSSRVHVGEEVVAIGFPGGLSGDATATRGLISAIRAPYLQTDAPMNPGNSGGPLVNLRGEIIGINTWKPLSQTGKPLEGVTFALASNDIQRILPKLMDLSSIGALRPLTPPSVNQIAQGGDSTKSPNKTIWAGQIIVDSNNDTHAAWTEKDNRELPRVLYSARKSDAGWAASQTVATGKRSSLIVIGGVPEVKALGMATDRMGTIHVVWHEELNQYERYIFYANKAPGKEWSSPVSLSSKNLYYRASMAIDGEDTLHLVMEAFPTRGVDPGETRIAYSYKPREGSWSQPESVPGTKEARDSNSVLTVDRNGTLFMAWQDNNGLIYVSEKQKGSSWKTPEIVSTPDGKSYNPSIVVDSENALYVAWMELPGRIAYRLRADRGGWSALGYLSDSSHKSFAPKLAVDAGDTVYAVWMQTANPEDAVSSLLSSRRPRGKDWSPVYTIFDGESRSLSPVAASVDSMGRIHVLVDELLAGSTRSLKEVVALSP